MTISAANLNFKALNDRIREAEDGTLQLTDVLGQRYIGAGLSGKRLDIYGVPGNAMGAYMEDSILVVHGNAQDAVGDTMNGGEIAVNGSVGDALGYAMRGGRILVKGNAGYRCGIHMKAYRERIPVIVIGGKAGSFLGEYQAGGRIIVLGLGIEGSEPPVGDFIGTGMHGGAIYLRCDKLPEDMPAQVASRDATAEDLNVIRGDVEAFCAHFGYDAGEILSGHFFCLTPDTANPYKRMYTYQ